MIAYIYGTYRTIIDSFRPNGINCYNCNSTNQVVVEKTTRVLHLFYIPIIPIGTKNSFICKSCNNEFDLKDLNSESRNYYSGYKSKKGIPFWLFSGPILILLGICWFTLYQINHENELLERLTKGNQNQIIEYKAENGKYTTLKTFKISADSVWVSKNQLETENYDNIDIIAPSINYSSDTTKISMTELMEFLDKGKVKAIYPSR